MTPQEFWAQVDIPDRYHITPKFNKGCVDIHQIAWGLLFSVCLYETIVIVNDKEYSYPEALAYIPELIYQEYNENIVYMDFTPYDVL